MILSADIESKSIQNKQLFSGLRFSVQDKEKVAIIGRNGVGKTTLFRMLTKLDTDFAGAISSRRGAVIVATAQEHHNLGSQTMLEYIVTNLPEYQALKTVLDTYPDTMGDNMRLIHEYSDALERFGALDYYTVEDRVLQSLDAYQLLDKAELPMKSLSGGQKRFAELIRVEHSHADLALIDEPTNHMDYIAKEAFLKWFDANQRSVVVITHDRDVLTQVDRIVEIKDFKAQNYIGNYDAYLKQNAQSTTTRMHDYEVTKRQIANLKDKVVQFRRLKEKARDPDTIKQFKRRENTAIAELTELEKIEKPSFWIDQESVSNLKPSIEASYHEHKSRTIKIKRVAHDERRRELLRLEGVQVGYDTPLFKPLHLVIETGERVRIVGRNGAGKTTLVRSIINSLQTRSQTLLQGTIKADTKLRINTYEQEIDDALLKGTLGNAIRHIYETFDLPSSDEVVRRTLSDYLFDPYEDLNHAVADLSGGQKARLQLIQLFANSPNLIILDEPTNHLDLPSIEELESVLKQYKGALIYISHDSYLSKNLSGQQIDLERL